MRMLKMYLDSWNPLTMTLDAESILDQMKSVHQSDILRIDRMYYMLDDINECSSSVEKELLLMKICDQEPCKPELIIICNECDNDQHITFNGCEHISGSNSCSGEGWSKKRR
jgi:hypothetical protein